MSPEARLGSGAGGGAGVAPAEPPPPPPQMAAFASGKGGVGRSLLAANAGVLLASRGARVVLFDADLGNCNLHTLVGVEAPERTLDDFVHRRVERLDALATPTRIANLGLVSAARDPLSAASLKHGSRTRLFAHLATIQADYVVVDTPVGTGLTTLDLFNQSACPVLVTTPSPAAIERSWRFLCAAFIRHALRLGPPPGARKLLEEAFDQPGGRPAPAPGALLMAARALDDGGVAAGALEQARDGFRPALIVNDARSKSDSELADAIRVLARQRLDVEVDVLGTVVHDEAVHTAACQRRPAVLDAADTPAVQQIQQVVQRLQARLDAAAPQAAVERAAEREAEQ